MASNFTIDGIAALQEQETSQKASTITKERERTQRAKMVEKAQVAQAKTAQKQEEKDMKAAEDTMRRLLITKINKRFEVFPKLKGKFGKLREAVSLQELCEVDELQKLELSMDGAEKRIEEYIKEAGWLSEKIVGDGSNLPAWVPENLRFDLSGIQQVLSSEPFLQEIRPLIAETVIEYPNIGNAPLALRWISALFKAFYFVNLMNKNKEVIAKLQQDFLAKQSQQKPDTATTSTETQATAVTAQFVAKHPI